MNAEENKTIYLKKSENVVYVDMETEAGEEYFCGVQNGTHLLPEGCDSLQAIYDNEWPFAKN